MAKKKIHELPDPIGAVDLGTSYVVVDSYDVINDEYKTVKLPADEVGGETGNFVEKTGDTMTGDLVVNVNETVEGIIVFDFGAMLTGVEYTSGSIPPNGAYANGANGIPMKSTDGVGQDATFVVSVESGNVIVLAGKLSGGMPVHNGGINFEIGDTIILSGSYLNGADGADDITITVTQTVSTNNSGLTRIGGIFETNAEAIFNAETIFNESAYFKRDLNLPTTNQGTNNVFGLDLFGNTYQQKISNPNNDNSIGISSTEYYYRINHSSGESQNTSISISSNTVSLAYDSGNISIQPEGVYLQKNFNQITVFQNSITFDYVTTGTLKLLFKKLPVFADNATAVAGGLAVDTVYKTATGELRIVI